MLAWQRQGKSSVSICAFWDALFYCMHAFLCFYSASIQPSSNLLDVNILGIWSHVLPPTLLLLSHTSPLTSSIFTPAILGFIQPPCTVSHSKWTIPAYSILRGIFIHAFGIKCTALKSNFSITSDWPFQSGKGFQVGYSISCLMIWSKEGQCAQAALHWRNERKRRRRGGGEGFIMMFNLTRRLHRSSVPRP